MGLCFFLQSYDFMCKKVFFSTFVTTRPDLEQNLAFSHFRAHQHFVCVSTPCPTIATCFLLWKVWTGTFLCVAGRKILHACTVGQLFSASVYAVCLLWSQIFILAFILWIIPVLSPTPLRIQIPILPTLTVPSSHVLLLSHQERLSRSRKQTILHVNNSRLHFEEFS
jgi:hypothetical protein